MRRVVEALTIWRQVHRDTRNITLVVANPCTRIADETFNLRVRQGRSIGTNREAVEPEQPIPSEAPNNILGGGDDSRTASSRVGFQEGADLPEHPFLAREG